MELTTPRLRLVPFDDNHLVDLHRLWTDADVRRYLWDDETISEEVAGEVIALSHQTFAEDGFGFWSLFSVDSNELVGFAGFRYFGEKGGEESGEDREIEILYGLFPAWWHRGLATEASRAVLAFAFDRAGLQEIFAGADPPNEASFEVMKRLGFTFHSHRTFDGVEAIYYRLTREEFASARGETTET